MGIRPQWTRCRAVGVAVAALVLISFLGPAHVLCPVGDHAEHGTPTMSLSETPAGEHGCNADHQGRPDVRADRTSTRSRGVDGLGLMVVSGPMPAAVATTRAVTTRRTRCPRHGRGRWRPGRVLLVDLGLARS